VCGWLALSRAPGAPHSALVGRRRRKNKLSGNGDCRATGAKGDQAVSNFAPRSFGCPGLAVFGVRASRQGLPVGPRAPCIGQCPRENNVTTTALPAAIWVQQGNARGNSKQRGGHVTRLGVHRSLVHLHAKPGSGLWLRCNSAVTLRAAHSSSSLCAPFPCCL
jgi:hypothetical protein